MGNKLLPTEYRKIRGKKSLEAMIIKGVEFNTDAVVTVAEMDAEEVAAIVGAGEAIVALQDAVGDSEGGLVADVAELQGVAAVATPAIAALQAAVGDAEGGLVADVTELQGVAGLVPGAALDISIPLTPAEFAFRDTGTTNRYTYTATPTADAEVNVALQKPGVTNISISPSGTTEHALTFNLPATKTIPIFAVAYNKGTHAGALTIGGEVVTGTGALSFVWDEETDEYVLADDTVTLKLEQTAPWNFVEFDAETLGCIPGSGKTFTLALPTTKVADFFFIQYETSASADGLTLIGDYEIDDGTGASGIVLCGWNGAEYDVNSVTLPRTAAAVLTLEDGGDDHTITIALPSDSSNIGRSLLLEINSTADSGSKTAVDLVGIAGEVMNSLADVANGVYFLFCGGTVGTNGGTRTVWTVISMPAED